jgi:hypothetical protein
VEATFHYPRFGDVVICKRDEAGDRIAGEVFVIACWPNLETTVAGPSRDYSEAVARARVLAAVRRRSVWLQKRAVGLRDESYERLSASFPADDDEEMSS